MRDHDSISIILTKSESYLPAHKPEAAAAAVVVVVVIVVVVDLLLCSNL